MTHIITEDKELKLTSLLLEFTIFRDIVFKFFLHSGKKAHTGKKNLSFHLRNVAADNILYHLIRAQL